MKVTELFEKDYTPRIRIDMSRIRNDDKGEVSSILRGLMCSIEGWGAISGLTNDEFQTRDPLILKFSSVENAHYFKECVEYYFSDDILDRLEVKRRVKKA
ncbi:hypothetical protein SAMN05216571_1223 [Onishia taeanensis]|uniref:Uncharacterized protein n=1 Tax=Onishia taeanensis TaxID=284577 RepID=A0A1G7VFK4_9GAMM|nr:hypothetical protein [Halomonas taeanensis]SDG58513.1 hypothetical protein SAMN05216571_1223 [Halomonas taeanensis]